MIMIGWNDLDDQPLERDIALTIGVFDGLHRGHRRLIDQVIRRGDGAAAVLTFSPLPSSVLVGTSDRLILSPRQKQRDLDKLGIEYLIVVDFSLDFSQITGEAFVSQMLRRAAISGVVVGRDFRCGSSRDTDAETLRALLKRRGVDVDIVEIVCCQTANVYSEVVVREGDAGTKVSSSSIRQAINDGDFATVRSLLGRDYELDVQDVTPGRVGDCLAFPVSALTQIMPKPGRYSGAVTSAAGHSAACITVESHHVLIDGIHDDLIDDNTIEIRFEGKDT